MTLIETGNQPLNLPLTFALPEEFRSVDFGEEPASRAERLYEQLRSSLPGLTAEEQLHILLANQYAIERMVDEGVIYAANFLGRSERDPTAPSIAQFTVLLRAATDRQGRALEVVLDALRRERKNCEAQYVDLPIGRCLVVMEDDRFQTPVNLVGHPGDVVHHVRQIQLIFPLVDRGQLVFFALSTECLRDWDDYVGMMAEICKTVTWSDSGESSTISSALDG